MSIGRAAVRGVALMIIVLGPLLGCASRDSGEPPATPAIPTTAATDELRLGLTEWSIETDAALLRPGDVQVAVTNTGGTRHDVVIQGQLGTWATPILDPGQRHDLTISAAPGEELHLVCTVTGHESQGMHTEIRVEDGP